MRRFVVVLACVVTVAGVVGCSSGHRSAARPPASRHTAGRSNVVHRAAVSAAEPGPEYETEVLPNGGVEIVSAQVGFALSGEPSPGFDGGVGSPGGLDITWPSPSVLVTHDGARHWTRSLAAPTGFWGIDALNTNDVWAVGVTALYRSVDGGRTWQSAHEASKSLVRVAFTSPSAGFGLTVKGRLVQTVNAGESWTASSWHGQGFALCPMYGGAMLVADETGGIWRSAGGDSGWSQVAPGFAYIQQYYGWPTQLSCQGSNAVEMSSAFCEASCGGGFAVNVRQTTDDGFAWQTTETEDGGPNPTVSQPVSGLGELGDAVAVGVSGVCMVSGYGIEEETIGIVCPSPTGTGYWKAALPYQPFGREREQATVQGIDFLNASTGWLVLDGVRGQNSTVSARTEIWATSNGGLTWRLAYLTPIYRAINCPGAYLPDDDPQCWRTPLG
jgi:hypothetical protein